MNNRSKKSTPITQQKITVPKGLQLICAIFAFLLDLAVIWIIVEYVSELKFLICPVLLAVLDLCFIFKVIFSNYRFAYAFHGVLIHIALIVVVCAYSIVSTGLLDERIVFVDIALYAMPAVHLLQCFAVLLNAVHFRNHKKLFRRIFAIVMTVVFVAGVGIYARYLMLNGFFGQGNIKMQRTVTYQLDEGGDAYVVTGILEGRGNAVIIPETFNGLPVKGIDCMLFTNEGLKYVTLDCASDIRFTNVAGLNHVSDDLRIETSKMKLDIFRNAFYTLALENEQILSIANNVYPSDLKEEEVYVTFSYTYDLLKLADGEILPTWFGNKGDTFDIHAHASSIPYIKYSDIRDGDSLYWCFTNQQRKIFRTVLDANGTSMNSGAVAESMNLSLYFDSVYQLNFEEDNDTKFEISEDYTSFILENGEKQNYRLATSDRISEIILAVPQRNGFSLSWFVGSDKRELKDMEADIAAQLAVMNEAGNYKMSLHPVWDLRAPTIDRITADGVSKGHSAVYGSNVVLDSAATPPHESISVKYQWKYGKTLGDSNKYTILNLHPDDAGTYTLVVTAYAESTSLTKTVEATIDVGFQKKELNFTWLLPTDLIYSATDKPISVQYDASDVINNDTIGSQLTQNSVRDARSYTIELSLTGDAATKYQIPEADSKRDLEIKPYTLAVKWGPEAAFTYDGKEQRPTASAIGLGNDGEINISVSGRKNVGQWDAKATTTNTNYTLSNDTKICQIMPRPITGVTWANATSFVYNGLEQGASVKDMENVVDIEKTAIISSLIYTGREINVGTNYTVSISLPDDSNYILACDPYRQFSITPMALQILIDNKTHTYSGTAYSEFTATNGQLASTDRIEEIVSLQYKGAAVSAINVKSGGYVIDADMIPLSKYQNYTITLKTGTLTIAPKKLIVKLNNAEKTYDGLVFPEENYTFTWEGLVENYDSIQEVLSLKYKGEAVDAVNFRNTAYVLDADYQPGSKGGNYDIQILKASLKINKAPLTVTAIGSSKIYDGVPHNAFEIQVSGLVNNEKKEQLGTPQFSGEATQNKNVGTHILSVSLPANAVTSNYQITTINGECQISPKPLTITAVGGTKVYNGLAGGTFSFKADGLVEGDENMKWQLGTAQYSGAAKTDKNVGVHVLQVRFGVTDFIKNYDVTYVDGEFEITKKPVTVTVRNGSKIYDGMIADSFDYEISGLVSGDSKAIFGNPIFSGSATENANVGSYEVSVVLPGNSNYEITSYQSGTYSIIKRALTVTAIATPKTYDGTVGGEFKFEVSGLANGETQEMLGAPTYAGTALTAKNAGSYSLTVSLASNSVTQNYNIRYNAGTFEIKKKALTVTAIAQDITYGEKNEGLFSFRAEGLINGETAEQLGSPIYGGTAVNAKNAGTYTLTVSFSQNSVNKNYQINSVSDTFEIRKKTLTVTAMCADRVYGEPIGNTFSFTADGLVNGDTASQLGTPVYGNEAMNSKYVGSYTLTVSFAANNVNRNYDIIYVNNTFEITKKDLTITAVAEDRVYDDDMVGGEFSFVTDGLIDGDEAFLGEPVFGGTALTATEEGTYTLTVMLDGFTLAGNYNITYVEDAEFVISPAPVEETQESTQEENE